VHGGPRAQFLAGPVAHGNDKIPIVLDVADMAGQLAAQGQAVAGSGGEGARIDPRGRVGAGGGGRQAAGLAPRCWSSSGSGPTPGWPTPPG
jgi:hypothetical protein